MQWLIDIIFKKLDAAGYIKITAVEAYLQGMILMWSGTLDNIPDGWAVCDGSNGTPDLSNRFVIGSAHLSPPHETGGSTTHRHFFITNGHDHEIPGSFGIDLTPGSKDYWQTAVDTGQTVFENHIPPYYVIAFIMKL